MLNKKKNVHRHHGTPEAVARRFSIKKVLLKNLQILRENTCARLSFLIKLQVEGTGVLQWILQKF